MRSLPQAGPDWTLRQTARLILAEALDRLDLKATMRRKLALAGSVLHIGETAYQLHSFSRILLIAVGKAARPMAEGMLELLDPHLLPSQTLTGIVIGTSLPAEPDPRLIWRLGSHPLPDQTSLDAAQSILHLLESANDNTLVFFLMSGGSSAMVELPFDPRVSLPDLMVFYRALVHSGLSIGEMNTLRKQISAVKGGRLALAAAVATQCTLLVSDVPPQHPEIIGSGPSLPDSSSKQDCRALLATRFASSELPTSVVNVLLDPAAPDTPKADHAAFRRASFHTLLSSDDLCQAAQARAEAHGFRTVIDLTCDEWDYREAAQYLLGRLNKHPAGGPVCLISAGELSVPITGESGIGGRNQQFVLECARLLASGASRTTVLSAGSDGADGNSPAAGAVADETTAKRAQESGLNLSDALAGFDAFPLFHALGDSIVTGPSGNNLRDLRLFLRH